MCALAHFFEEEGLATTVIALVRKHAELIRPPRAIWVPFELGRPFGGPNNAIQQTQVLQAALELLEERGPGPILRDFPEIDKADREEETWVFPAKLEGNDVLSEVRSVQPFWERAHQRHGRTTVGISGHSPSDAVEFIHRYFSDIPMINPKGMARVARARFSIDDIKAFYSEAATAIDDPSSSQIHNWFWKETLAGAMILAFQKQARLCEDKNLNLIAGSLVPAERVLPN